ncbi:MAG: metalloprotease family protein [Christensenellaceae bacterium]
MEIITNFLYQIIFTVGVIVAFGLLIALCRKAFCQIVGDNGTKILLITGVVGTPIHELSHALMCIIFGHKIVEMKLYQLNSDDGTLGYVNHTYNPKNLYHQIGNFFIGVAPILCGSGVLLLLMYLFVPSIFSEVMAEFQFIGLLSTDFFDLSTYAGYLDLFGEIVSDIFDFTNSGNILWWIFIVLALMISGHMELSTADIKSGFKGFLFMAGALLVTDIILYFVSISALESVTTAMTSFALYIASFLAISGVFSGVTVLIALAIKGVTKITKK